MAKKVQRPAAKEQVELAEQATRSPANQETNVSDLEQLRDILYGNQARALDERLNRLERHLESTRQQLIDNCSERLDNLRESSQEQLGMLRKELVDSVEQHIKNQSDQLQETHTEFDAKSKQNTAELETTKKDLSAAVEQQSADFNQRLELTQKEIRKQIEALDSDFRERLQSHKEESNKRDDDLRQEFIALGAWLDDKKASRHDLGQMLVQIGQRLGQDKESLLDDPENEPAK